jgi:uncharacterized protein (DUF58 family)
MTSLLQPDLIARAEALGLKARAIVEGLRVGDHRSPYRGFSVEFVQHREYVPGDDTRHIDWKVYGRAERYTIKQYEQETNFQGHILLDASRSMTYGAGPSNKLDVARVLAATLAYLIVHQRDSAGLGVFDSDWRHRLPPSGRPEQVRAILRALAAIEPGPETAIGPLLHELAETVHRRGLVFLITDALDPVDALLAGLKHLRFRGHEVVVFHVLHPDELRFPFDGPTRFDALEGALRLRTRPDLIRAAYLRALDEHLDALRAGCAAQRCDYVLIDTSIPLTDSLTEYLARRGRVRRV